MPSAIVTVRLKRWKIVDPIYAKQSLLRSAFENIEWGPSRITLYSVNYKFKINFLSLLKLKCSQT